MNLVSFEPCYFVVDEDLALGEKRVENVDALLAVYSEIARTASAFVVGLRVLFRRSPVSERLLNDWINFGGSILCAELHRV